MHPPQQQTLWWHQEEEVHRPPTHHGYILYEDDNDDILRHQHLHLLLRFRNPNFIVTIMNSLIHQEHFSVVWLQ